MECPWRPWAATSNTRGLSAQRTRSTPYLSLKSISIPWLCDFFRICFLAMLFIAYHCSSPFSSFSPFLITAFTWGR